MRYQTIPRWTMIMLIVMGLGFVAGSLAFALFVPQPTGTIVGAIWFVMGGGIGLDRDEARASHKRFVDEVMETVR